MLIKNESKYTLTINAGMEKKISLPSYPLANMNVFKCSIDSKLPLQVELPNVKDCRVGHSITYTLNNIPYRFILKEKLIIKLIRIFYWKFGRPHRSRSRLYWKLKPLYWHQITI